MGMSATAAPLALLSSSAANFLADETRERKAILGGRRSAAAAGRAVEQMGIAQSGEDFLDSLEPGQFEALRTAVGGAAFRDLVRQATVAMVNQRVDKEIPALREQVGHHLRLSGVSDVYLATDAVMPLVLSAAFKAVEELPVDARRSPSLLATAADVAAAGVRNSALLQRIDSLARLDDFARSLRASTVALHTRFRVSQTGQARFVRFDELYISPRIRPSSATSAMRDSIQDQVAHRLRMVILGDPGAGKSTFAAKLAHDIAADEIPGLEGTVPVLLTVRQHTASLRHEHNTLLQYLEASCRRPHQLDPAPDALEYLLLNGRAVVIIDGVDELGDSTFRASFAEMVNAFAHRYPLARVVVTSRIVGYPDAPLDSDLFSIAEMAPFSFDQVREYLQRWFALDPTLSDDQRDSHVASFIRESEEVSDLRANPLLLSLLCTVYASTHYIPRNRPAIYEKCAELLFETWDRSRGINVEYRFGGYIRPAVQRMAWHLFNDPTGRQALPRSEFQDLLADYLQTKQYEDREEALQAADDFLRFCAGRAWVLTDVGSDVLQPYYGFVHRTFLEYFAATQLVRSQPEPSAVWKKTRPHAGDATWTIVNVLAVQILDRAYEDGADALLSAAVDGVSEQTPSSEALDELRLVVNCLDSVTVSTDVIRAIARKCVAISTKVPLMARRTASRGLAPFAAERDVPLSLLMGVRLHENRERIQTSASDALRHAATQNTPDSSAAFVYAVLAGMLPDSRTRHVHPGFLRSLADDPPDPVRLLAAEHEHPSADGILSDCGAALLSWTHFELFRVPAPAREFLDRIPNRSRAEEFVRLYNPIVTVFPKYMASVEVTESYSQHVTTMGDRNVVSSELLDDLTPHGRAIVLLILAASAPDFFWVSPDDRIAALLASRDDPSRRPLGKQLLEAWSIPPAARALLEEWIDRVPIPPSRDTGPAGT
jgi:hypothetical protein